MTRMAVLTTKGAGPLPVLLKEHAEVMLRCETLRKGGENYDNEWSYGAGLFRGIKYLEGINDEAHSQE